MVDIPGNATTKATFQGDLGTVASYSGTFERPGDVDWIRLDLVAGETYRFFATDNWTSTIDLSLSLLAADGTELAQGNSVSDELASLTFTATTTGSYFIAATNLDSPTDHYTISAVNGRYQGAIVTDIGIVDAGHDIHRMFTSGSPDDDMIDKRDGDRVADIIFGGAGNDTIYAGPEEADPKFETRDYGNIVYGGDGDDWIVGGTDRDTLYGDSGNDMLAGGLGSDTLWGGAGNDTLVGSWGADQLSGGTGADKMAGGNDSDTYYVDNNSDIVDETGATGIADKVYASINFRLSDPIHCKGEVEDLVLVGAADIAGTGNALNNHLYGNAGANTLKGAAGSDGLDGRGGNDILIGGAGADRLTGGLGADLFVFNAASESPASATGRDIILDFNRAQGDRIDLHAIDAATTVAGDQAFEFIGTAAFSHHAGELRFQTLNGNSYVYGDIDGDGSADFSVKVEHIAAVLASDFIL